jgi:hypothetical protein
VIDDHHPDQTCARRTECAADADLPYASRDVRRYEPADPNGDEQQAGERAGREQKHAEAVESNGFQERAIERLGAADEYAWHLPIYRERGFAYHHIWIT